mgnify:CR=1 FL=1
MPDRNRPRTGGRPEFEVAYYTKELGKALQRQMLEKQLSQLSENITSASSHGEEPAPPADSDPPQDDRAG